MNLLRFLLHAGGEGFRAVEFSSAAVSAGIPMGAVAHIRKPQCGPARDSGLPGTGGDAFLLWRSAKVDYAMSMQQYRAQQVFGAPEFLQSWKREEEAILDYLGWMAERLPRVCDYCDGDSFLLLKLIYGEEEEGGAGTTGWLYSAALMQMLARMGAGLEADQELVDVHFARVESGASSCSSSRR
ncbi:hypothetical protein [Paracidovorax oryzae]|uniref:hypothetical protein n=1 Tax=Paracidovorax oryzae TaxID=862720 RepID=UPI0035CF89A6